MSKRIRSADMLWQTSLLLYYIQQLAAAAVVVRLRRAQFVIETRLSCWIYSRKRLYLFPSEFRNNNHQNKVQKQSLFFRV
jgi:hypothetical protein